jgi:glycine oxidase
MAFDVVVVGAGIVGCSVAWRLAREGASVALVERGEVGAEASWAGGGQLVPEAGREGAPGPLLDHWLAALRMYPEYVAAVREETGAQLELKQGGRLLVAHEEGQLVGLREHFELQNRHGVRAEWWEGDQIAAAEPALAVAGSGQPPVLAAIHFPDHGFVENRRLVPALAQAVAKRGGLVRTHAPVSRLVVEGGRARGVEIAGGERIAAGAVVNAAGAWASQIGGTAAVPVGPSKGQMAALELRPMPLERIVSFAGVTFVPRADGRLLLAATKENDVGYDKRPTLWAMQHLLAGAMRHMPQLRQATLAETWAGLRPRAADDMPVVGRDELDGLYWATGHYSMGILSAPATAEALTGLILRGQSPLPIDAFTPRRFAGAPAR